eukprot:13738698-Heterocapsa_arctica.AAC.1
MANHTKGPRERAIEAYDAHINANGLESFGVDDRPGSSDAPGTTYQTVEGDSCAAAVELRAKIATQAEDTSPRNSPPPARVLYEVGMSDEMLRESAAAAECRRLREETATVGGPG